MNLTSAMHLAAQPERPHLGYSLYQFTIRHPRGHEARLDGRSVLEGVVFELSQMLKDDLDDDGFELRFSSSALRASIWIQNFVVVEVDDDAFLQIFL